MQECSRHSLLFSNLSNCPLLYLTQFTCRMCKALICFFAVIRNERTPPKKLSALSEIPRKLLLAGENLWYEHHFFVVHMDASSPVEIEPTFSQTHTGQTNNNFFFFKGYYVGMTQGRNKKSSLTFSKCWLLTTEIKALRVPDPCCLRTMHHSKYTLA